MRSTQISTNFTRPLLWLGFAWAAFPIFAGDEATTRAQTRRSIQTRLSIPEAEWKPYVELLEKHDLLLAERNRDELLELYSPDFLSFSLQAVRVTMVDAQLRMLQSLGHATFDNTVRRIDQLETFSAVTVCRPMHAKGKDQSSWTELHCQTLILSGSGQPDSPLQILNHFNADTSAEKIDSFHDDDRLYRSSKCGYEIAYPKGFLPIPTANGSRVDVVSFFDPGRQVIIHVQLSEPDLPLPVERLLALDAPANPGSPVECISDFEHRDGFPSAMVEQRFGDSRNGHVRQRIYVSPDRRLVFSFTLLTPAEHYSSVCRTLERLAHSLQLSTEVEKLAATVESAWPQRLHEGRFTAGPEGVHLTVPKGLNATALMGPIARLRLEDPSLPDTIYLVRAYGPDQMREPVSALVNRAVAHVRSSFCQPGGNSKTDMPVFADCLGAPVSAAGVTVPCAGTRPSYHLIACFELDGWSFQVQLIPGEMGDPVRQREHVTHLLNAFARD